MFVSNILNSNHNYDGRSINKLQNGAIPSVLKIRKIRNIRFVTYLSNDPRIAGAFCLQDAIVTEMALLVANLL